MKRDLDLIRSILLRVESSGPEPMEESTFSDLCSDAMALRYNIMLIAQAGFIDVDDVSVLSEHSPFPKYDIYNLTNKGCDYLDSVRDASTWQKVKEALKTAGGDISLDVVKSLATEAASLYLKSHLPLQ